MEQGLYSRAYFSKPRAGRDFLSVVTSAIGLGAVGWAVTQTSSLEQLVDVRSIFIVGVGTVATTLLQYNFRTCWLTLVSILRSLLGTPVKAAVAMRREIDDAIINGDHLVTLREGTRVTGELLNDIVFMYRQGLLFDEIDQFVTSRLEAELSDKRVAAELLRRAALTAPALGLFGTVLGLTGVLRSMDDPTKIGPLMSLALMTTAYGSGLGSFACTPLAGRLEHHNTVFVEVHRQLLSRVGILLAREERTFGVTHAPQISDNASDQIRTSEHADN
ncbi:MAG: MotA/TolQ/ExbB proton channel family protein [Myxococcales bacterium]|nr:MotA/TolQ/ExbB proton channel family protein [Myxococcales bacterium]